MIRVICGLKGSGKTKRLIDQANDALKTEHGLVAFIDDDTRYMYDLRHEVRFINASEYGIQSADMFYGFLCGMISSNFDITTIYVDAFMKLVKCPFEDLEPFFRRLSALAEAHKVTLTISVSGDPEAMPAFITQYAI